MTTKDRKQVKVIDAVSQDKDWRGVIENELRCQENWQKEWGFLSSQNIGIGDVPLTKLDKIRVLEEKLKSMDEVKIQSEFKTKFYSKEIDLKQKDFNKRKQSELQSQSRRPKADSIAHKKLLEAIGDNYENEPYQNYLGSK
jgi:hypothetical protein